MSAPARKGIILDDRHRILMEDQASTPSINIFNEAAFLNLHKESAQSVHCFELEDYVAEKIIARCHFAVKSGEFRSPIQGSYGGFEFLVDLQGPQIERFILKTVEILSELGRLPIEIVSAPFCYADSESSIVHNVLLRAGFTKQIADLNYHRIVLANDEFEVGVNHGNIKRLRKATERSLVFSVLDSFEYQNAYELIASNRRRRGFPVTMSWQQICDMVNLFPERMRFMAVYDGGIMVASSICITVRRDILYVFYWGDGEGQQQLSPVTYLAKGIFLYCQKMGVRVLDIGTATIDGAPNWGLVGYKANLGFQPSLKIRYRREAHAN